MQLEFHQLDRRWEHLRVRHPARQRRRLGSLADAGQQTPIVVVADAGQPNRYLVIDGYKRLAALQQLAGTRWKRWSGRWVRPRPCCWIGRCVSPRTRRRWSKAGCCRKWSSASAMDWMNWRAGSIAA